MEKRPFWILPAIVFTQFAGTSLWFATNAILGELQILWALGDNALGYMTSAVQLGFIAGTLLFAFFMVSDRFSPRRVFFLCSLAGAFSNLLLDWLAGGMTSLMVLRFITGFFLAGIYPVGMKIAAMWYRKELGKALGFLVGALVLGTAFPHLIRGTGQMGHWKTVIYAVSGISALGGFTMLLVPEGPFLTKKTKLDFRAMIIVFQSRDLRSAAFGYFGHMWELYTFWAFLPYMIEIHMAGRPEININISLFSFLIITAGSIGCIVGGIISRKTGSLPVAIIALTLSGVCCLLSPLFLCLPTSLFTGSFILWGLAVVGDSPQLSSLVAKKAPQDLAGSALTLVNAIGFSITIISIQFITYLMVHIPMKTVFMFLFIGPVLGLAALYPQINRPSSRSGS